MVNGLITHKDNYIIQRIFIFRRISFALNSIRMKYYH